MMKALLEEPVEERLENVIDFEAFHHVAELLSMNRIQTRSSNYQIICSLRVVESRYTKGDAKKKRKKENKIGETVAVSRNTSRYKFAWLVPALGNFPWTFHIRSCMQTRPDGMGARGIYQIQAQLSIQYQLWSGTLINWNLALLTTFDKHDEPNVVKSFQRIKGTLG